MTPIRTNLSKIFRGDTLILLLIACLCLVGLHYIGVLLDQNALQTKALALAVEEGYKQKLLQYLHLVLIAFLTMCQAGFLKFPGAWNVREPWFYETIQFEEYCLLATLGLIAFMYIIHLLPIYLSVLRVICYNIYKGHFWKQCTFLFLSSLLAPSWCEGGVGNYYTYTSESYGSDGMPEPENWYLVFFAYALRSLNLWQLPPGTVLFDMASIMLGVKLAVQNILVHFLYNVGTVTGLVLIAKNIKSFPFLSFLVDHFNHLVADPSDRMVAILEAFIQTQHSVINMTYVYIFSCVVICLWLWMKSLPEDN